MIGFVILLIVMIIMVLWFGIPVRGNIFYLLLQLYFSYYQILVLDYLFRQFQKPNSKR